MTAPPIPTNPAPPADFTREERHLLAEAQRALLARRQADHEFRRALRESEPRPLFPRPLPASSGPEVASQGSGPAVPARPPQGPPVPRIRPRVPSNHNADPTQLTARALDQAEQSLSFLRQGIQARARRVYATLAEAACTLLARRGQSAHTTSASFFTVLDALPAVTGLSAATCERALADLREIGLIHTRRWYTSDRFLDRGGEPVTKRCCGGVFLCILLKTAPGRRALLRPEDLAGAPRDLTADRKAGRTAWQWRKEQEGQVRESSSQTERKVLIGGLLQWALKEPQPSTSVEEDSLTDHGTPLELVWGLPETLSVRPQLLGDAIFQAASALSRAFHDPRSVKHYCRLLHRALAADWRGLRGVSRLQFTLQRVLLRMREGELRRPGALVIQELRASGWWDEIYRAA